MFLRICIVFSILLAGCGSTDGESRTSTPSEETKDPKASSEGILSELDALVDVACGCVDVACRTQALVDLQEWSVRHGPSQKKFTQEQKAGARAKADAFARCVNPAAP